MAGLHSYFACTEKGRTPLEGTVTRAKAPRSPTDHVFHGYAHPRSIRRKFEPAFLSPFLYRSFRLCLVHRKNRISVALCRAIPLQSVTLLRSFFSFHQTTRYERRVSNAVDCLDGKGLTRARPLVRNRCNEKREKRGRVETERATNDRVNPRVVKGIARIS